MKKLRFVAGSVALLLLGCGSGDDPVRTIGAQCEHLASFFLVLPNDNAFPPEELVAMESEASSPCIWTGRVELSVDIGVSFRSQELPFEFDGLQLGAASGTTFPVRPGEVVGLDGDIGSRVLLLPLHVPVAGEYEVLVDLSARSFVFSLAP